MTVYGLESVCHDYGDNGHVTWLLCYDNQLCSIDKPAQFVLIVLSFNPQYIRLLTVACLHIKAGPCSNNI